MSFRYTCFVRQVNKAGTKHARLHFRTPHLIDVKRACPHNPISPYNLLLFINARRWRQTMRENFLSLVGCPDIASKSAKVVRQHKSGDVAEDPRQPLVGARQIDPNENWIMLLRRIYTLKFAVRGFRSCPSSYSESPDKSIEYCISAVLQ